jgi:hypothetical protein
LIDAAGSLLRSRPREGDPAGTRIFGCAYQEIGSRNEVVGGVCQKGKQDKQRQRPLIDAAGSLLRSRPPEGDPAGTRKEKFAKK